MVQSPYFIDEEREVHMGEGSGCYHEGQSGEQDQARGCAHSQAGTLFCYEKTCSPVAFSAASLGLLKETRIVASCLASVSCPTPFSRPSGFCHDPVTPWLGNCQSLLHHLCMKSGLRAPDLEAILKVSRSNSLILIDGRLRGMKGRDLTSGLTLGKTN